jgi:uncharacterized protein YdhG (YjbR/CyaY superfamily)
MTSERGKRVRTSGARRAVHAGCPEVIETIKSSMPAFEYKGPLVGTAAFKAHCGIRRQDRNWKYVR